MIESDVLEKIKKLVKKNPTNFSNTLHKKENKEILNWIFTHIPQKLQYKEYNLSTIVYWIVNNLEDFPKCHNCNQVLLEGKNIIFTKGYPEYCRKCSHNTPEAIEKRKETCLKKYGVDNPFKSKDIKNKIKETNIKRYGTSCPAQSEYNKEKTKQNNLEKYGTEFYQSTQEYKDKVKETCLRKYGVSDVFHVEEFKQKSKDTIFKKYGVEHIMKSKDVKNKIKEHLKEKYGENYCDVLWGNKGNLGQIKRAYQFILRNPLVVPLFSEKEFVDGKSKDINTKFSFKCKKCGTEFQSVWDNGGTRVCPKCKIKGYSELEKELCQYIQSITKNNLKYNNRELISPYELDIVDKDNKICFEFDGLYWHCDDINRNHRYHLQKTEKCESLGYHLIHIFENEWIYKQDIVKSRIANLYGNYEKVIYARKCKIKLLDWATTEEFLNNNHIQGSCKSSINLGLYFEDELVSIMTFGKSRFNKKYEYELLRFCNKLNYRVIGGAGKLLKYFERNYNPKSLISYADRRWSKGNLYEKLGFSHINNTPPNYWYIDFHNRMIYSRMKFQKHKLKEVLKVFDENLSETENMKNNGYGKIYDCGNMIFEKTYTIRN